MSDKLARLRLEVFGPTAEAEEELASLWREVFGQPPPVIGAPRLLARVLIQNLPPAPPYRPAGPEAPVELRSFTALTSSKPADHAGASPQRGPTCPRPGPTCPSETPGPARSTSTSHQLRPRKSPPPPRA